AGSIAMRRAESTGECAYLHPLRSRTSRPLRHNPDDLADSGLRAQSELGCLSSYSSPSLLGSSTPGMRPRLRNRLYSVIADEHGERHGLTRTKERQGLITDFPDGTDSTDLLREPS